MKILVTGASGFIGSHAVIGLAQKGHFVTGLLRGSGIPDRVQRLLKADSIQPSSKFLCDAVNFVHCDLLDSRSLKNIFSSEKIDCVVNLAAYAVQNEERNPTLAYKINYEAAKLLAQLASEFRCKHFVHFGTSKEYGDMEGIVTEAHVTKPSCLYGKSKLEGGLAVRAACSDGDMPLSYLRLFNTYGPLENKNKFFPSVFEILQNGMAIKLSGGFQYKDFLYVSDVVNAIDCVIRRKKIGSFELMNLAYGEAFTLRQYAKMITDLFGFDYDILPWAEDNRPDLSCKKFEVNLQKTINTLNWSPRVSLAEGLKITGSFK